MQSESSAAILAKLARGQLDQQRLLVPHNMRRLVEPVLGRTIRQLEIEIPEHVGDDEAHLVVGETVRDVSRNELCLTENRYNL